MIKWVFKKFLCSQDIHKIITVGHEIFPLKNLGTPYPPRRFCDIYICKYCRQEFEHFDKPSYPDALYEEIVVHGKIPFDLKAELEKNIKWNEKL